MTNIDAAAAVLALLTADTGLKVFDGLVPVDSTGKPPSRPYVVVFAPVGHSSVDDLAGRSRALQASIQTTCVGDSAESCRIVARRVKAALLDIRPVVVARVCYPIRHEDSQPPRADNDVQPPVMYCIDRWSTQSVPA